MQPLRGEKVNLRAIEPADIDEVYQWENDTSIWHLSNTIAPYSRFVLEQYLAGAHQDIFTSKQLRLVICLPSAKPIGCIDLFDFDPLHQRAGVGILIVDHADRGKGYASEALALLIGYCRDILHLNQLYCNITSGNDSSLKLFASQGFEICGTKKAWLRDSKGWRDESMLQLLF
jgi:diamine N-acetyltransferase